jgi:hypothetical protein
MTIEWLAETVRVSVFSSTAIKLTEEHWRSLTGQEEAETRQNVPGGRLFAGRFENAQLNLVAAGSRIDVVLSPAAATTPAMPPQILSVGPWLPISERFFSVTSSWLQDVPFPIHRIAFGPVLLFGTDGRTQSLLLLKDLLPSVVVDPDHMRDLLFRINWPTESEAIEGLLINRITHWSALQFFLKTIQIGDTVTLDAAPELHAVRLEIDHNTDLARTDPFDRTQIVPIYAELYKLALQNAAKGERP